MWYHGYMIDFPIGDLIDDSSCMLWLERHLRPSGLTGRHCRHADRRLLHAPGHFPADRCRACGAHTASWGYSRRPSQRETYTSPMSTGTSTSGPTTAASASPEAIPKTLIATAMASSKLLLAAVNDRVAVSAYGNFQIPPD